MNHILSMDSTPKRPFFPHNITFIDDDTPWDAFRARVIGGTDWKIIIRSHETPHSSLSDFFSSIGGTSCDVAQEEVYNCSSNIPTTILLYDKKEHFAAKLTFCFSDNPSICQLSIRFILWIPTTDIMHTLTIKVTPGNYTYHFSIHPTKYTAELKVPFDECPHPPGFYQHNISYTIKP
jgi:hypothetical protein